MADIWGRTILLGDIVQGETLRVTFGTQNLGLIVSRVEYRTNRPINQILNLADGKINLLATLPSLPEVTLLGVVSSSDTYKTFLQTFGTLCSTTDLTISIQQTLCSGGATTQPTLAYTLKNARLLAIGGAASNDNYVNIGTITLVGSHLEVA